MAFFRFMLLTMALLPALAQAQVTFPDTTVTRAAAPSTATPTASPLSFYGFVDRIGAFIS